MRRAWRAFGTWGDPVSRDMGLAGDRFVARFRLGLLALLALVPINSAVASPARVENWLALGCLATALLFALGFLRLAARPVPPAWLGFATSQFDVAIISLGFVSFILAGTPILATNSLVHYTVYFVALAGTGLRYDPRVSLAAGFSAFVQYGALVLWVAMFEPTVREASAVYGSFQWDSQVSRLQLIAVATVIHTAVVVRSRRFWLNSMRDRLTGLFNRGFFDESLARLVAASRGPTDRFAVAMIDLDHFKSVNDLRGHVAGDAALRRAADELRDLFRGDDVIARFGGDEFAVVVHADRATAAARLDQWRTGLADGASDPRVSASIGLAGFPEDGGLPEDLLRAADQRLYEAKARGRNRTVADDSADHEPGSLRQALTAAAHTV